NMVVGHQRDELEANMAGGDAGDFGVVIGRGHFHDVGANEVHAAEAANDLDELAAGDAAGFGSAGARCVGGVQHVDVDGDVERALADAVPDLGDGFQHALV